MASNSSIAGEMKATASPRSLSRRDRPGAGGVADATCPGWSVVRGTGSLTVRRRPCGCWSRARSCCSLAMSSSASFGSFAPLRAAFTLVFSMSTRRAYSGTFHMSRIRGDRVGVHLVERPGIEELGRLQGVRTRRHATGRGPLLLDVGLLEPLHEVQGLRLVRRRRSRPRRASPCRRAAPGSSSGVGRVAKPSLSRISLPRGAERRLLRVEQAAARGDPVERDAGLALGDRRVHLVDEPVAGALGGQRLHLVDQDVHRLLARSVVDDAVDLACPWRPRGCRRRRR